MRRIELHERPSRLEKHDADGLQRPRGPGPARGLLKYDPAPGLFHHARIAPAPDLADLVQHFWIVRWDLLGGPPQQRQTLPHPNLHAVLEGDAAAVHGVHTGRFTRRLEGAGAVFGIKFRVGGLRGVLPRPLSTLRNRTLPLQAVFADAALLQAGVRAAEPDDAGMVAAAQDFLRPRLPPPDAQAVLAAQIVEAIETDRELLRVAQLQTRWALGARALQRLFGECVGVGPKWVIGRYRLHEALARLDAGAPPDWAQLALDLGYFDQAHFIRDFKTMTGRAPTDYLRSGG